MESIYSFVCLLWHREANKSKPLAHSFIISHNLCRGNCATLTKMFPQLIISDVIINILHIHIRSLKLVD